MAEQAQATLVGAYAEIEGDPKALVTLAGAYVEIAGLAHVYSTFVGAYVEIDHVALDPDDYLLIRYGDTRFAIRMIVPPEYRGDDVLQPATLGRSTTGKGLRVVAPTAKKKLQCIVLLDKDPDGFAIYEGNRYYKCNDQNFYDALRERGLQVKTFENNAFWNAAWVERRWSPDLAYEPVATHRQKVLHLVER